VSDKTKHILVIGQGAVLQGLVATLGLAAHG